MWYSAQHSQERRIEAARLLDALVLKFVQHYCYHILLSRRIDNTATVKGRRRISSLAGMICRSYWKSLGIQWEPLLWLSWYMNKWGKEGGEMIFTCIQWPVAWAIELWHVRTTHFLLRRSLLCFKPHVSYCILPVEHWSSKKLAHGCDALDPRTAFENYCYGPLVSGEGVHPCCYMQQSGIPTICSCINANRTPW